MSTRKPTVARKAVALSDLAAIKKQLLDAAALAAALRQSAGYHPDTEVRLRADATVPYGRVVEVMGITHQAGLHRIGFVAEQVRAVK